MKSIKASYCLVKHHEVGEWAISQEHVGGIEITTLLTSLSKLIILIQFTWRLNTNEHEHSTWMHHKMFLITRILAELFTENSNEIDSVAILSIFMTVELWAYSECRFIVDISWLGIPWLKIYCLKKRKTEMEWNQLIVSTKPILSFKRICEMYIGHSSHSRRGFFNPSLANWLIGYGLTFMKSSKDYTRLHWLIISLANTRTCQHRFSVHKYSWATNSYIL